METIIPIVLRWIGASRYTDWALAALPYITKYAPIVLAWLNNAKETWADFKAKHPAIATFAESLAKKIFPGLSDKEWGAEIVLKSIFARNTRTPEEEKIWMERGTYYNPDLSDFPQQPTGGG